MIAPTCFGITLPSKKALGTLPDDGNAIPKHVRATIYD
jgi:hypothetical protein